MKKKIILTAIIGMIVMLRSVSFGAELTIYGTGGVTVNLITKEATVCPLFSVKKCATIILNENEIKILVGDIKSNYNGQGISGILKGEDGTVYNIIVCQGNISGASSGGYTLNDFNIKVINP